MASFTNKFESKKQDWTTPKSLFDKLDQEFHFERDLAADKNNTLCKRFYTKEDNALIQNWDGICYLNCPYGDKESRIVDWVKKAYYETRVNSNLVVIMLIPARTNTKWWADYVMKATEIRFIVGMPKFGNNKYGLPCPLALIIWKYNKLDCTKFSIFYL